MGGHLDGSKGVGVSRLEVIEGPNGRRRRAKAERARLVAESMMPGVTVADIARRNGTTRWQIYDWRRLLGEVALATSMMGYFVIFLLAAMRLILWSQMLQQQSFRAQGLRHQPAAQLQI